MILEKGSKKDFDAKYLINALNKFHEGKIEEGRLELDKDNSKDSEYAKFFLAEALINGTHGYNKDIFGAYEIYKHLCKQNVFEGCINLETFIDSILIDSIDSKTITLDLKKELDFYKKLCIQNNVFGYSLLYKILKILYNKNEASKYLVENYGFTKILSISIKLIFKKIIYKISFLVSTKIR